ncbi:probable serine incorporator isoform X2 [Ananas comosus]|uniref:Probable serine incorporator isoform X2 n=1 Tax=Ananas comosus TaxID=4615 RepID=A0A6P5ENZ2_ANACO|nr:probable serine incorporator isoform X2 [Ananas comosus]
MTGNPSEPVGNFTIDDDVRNEEVGKPQVLVDKRETAYAVRRKQSLRARYIFGFIFFTTNLLAWFFRDYGYKILHGLRHIAVCGEKGDECFHAGGVLRVSLGCFIFFSVMFASTFGARKLHEVRDCWHSRCWILKFLLFLVSIVISFIIPKTFIQLYGEVARIGAGIFLLLQLISMLQFLAWCNSQWMPDPQSGRCGFFGLFLSTISYIASFSGIVLMYIMYAPHLSCIINIFSITWTAILVIIMMIVSLHSKVNNGLLSSGIMGLYIVFLCWSAIESEPQNEKCKTPKKMAENGDWTTIVCFLIALCAIVMATFSTGIDTRSFQFVKDEAQLEDDIPYRYEIFHFVFSMGAMYFAMLFISWELDHPTRKWSIDVGWASTWVKIINEWLAASIYLWKLISPVIMRDNAIHHEESMQNVHSLV